MKTHHILSQSISALLLLLAPVGTQAAEKTLAGTPTSWFTGPWSPVGLPGIGDHVIITAAGAIDIRGSAAWPIANTTEIQDLALSSTAALTLSNQSTGQNMTLVLNGGRSAGIPLIATTGDFAYTITGINTAATPRTLTLQLKASGDINVAGNVLAIGSTISENGGARSITKTGAGTLTLSGSSSFTGGLTHAAGLLRATTSANSLGSGTLTLTGAELQLANNTGLAFNRNTTVSANTQITSDRLAAGAGVTHTLGTLSIGAQTLTIAPGTNSTSGTAGVTFGATTLTGAATFSVNTGAGLTLGATAIGANLLTLSGAGATTINGLSSAGDGALSVTGAGATTITTFTTGGAASIALTGSGATTISSLTSVGTGTLSMTGAGATTITTLTTGGTASVEVTGAGITTINGVVNAGGSGLIKTGAGRAILSGASTFATGVSVDGGVLEATNNGALGAGAVVVNTGGTLELNLANSIYTASSITANPGGRVAVRGVTTNSAVTLAGGILGTRTGDLGNYAGPVTVTADSSANLISYTSGGNGLSLTISGKLSGASALNVTGPAVNAGLKALILTNITNDFSGAFNVAAGQRLSSVPATTGSTLATSSINLNGGFLRLNDNGTGVDGTLAYGNNITVGTGGGTIDLDRVNGNNTGNTFALGSLAIGNETLAVNGGTHGYKASFTGGTLTGDATINNTGGVEIIGPVAGGFGLTKGGVGTLTLSGANGYTGATSVTAGTLNLTGSLAGGITVGASATLSGAGTVTGTATAENIAVINPGNAGSGTLTVGGLTFGAAATDTATVNFTTNALPGKINVTGAGGLVTNGGAATVSLNLLSTLPAVGKHTIIDYDGAIGGTGFSAFTLAPLPNPRIVATLFDNTTDFRVELDVTAVDAPRWSGAESSEWSTVALPAAKNWQLVIGVGPTDFISGDNVLFDDMATGSTAVVLNVEDVSPASVLFDNSIAKSYSLGGTNGIIGTTGLVKTNTGMLTISNANGFTGGVTINGGTVSVNAVADTAVNSPLGAGDSVNIGGGAALEFTGATGSTNRITNINAGGGTVKVAALSTLTLAGAVNTSGTFTLDNAGTATVSGAISGVSNAIVTGAGTTTISGNVTTSLALNGAGNTTVSGSISAAGALTKAGAGTAILTGTANNPSSTTISAGILQVGDGVASGSIGNGSITNNATLAFNNPTAVTGGGPIVGTGILTKTGAGNTTLNGAVANTFSGTTTVSGGNLVLSKTSGVNAIGGNLVVELGGTVSYGTTAGQLADHIPDTASVTINGGTFGSGAGNTLAAPTAGVTETVASVTVNSGSFISGRGLGLVPPAAFTVTGQFQLLGGSSLVSRGGGLSAATVHIATPAVLDLDGGSTTAGQQSQLTVGAGGLSLTGATINFNAGPSVVGATSVGSVVALNGNVTSTGASTFARLNPTLSSAIVDLALAERTFDVTGTLAVAPSVQNGAVRKTNTGTLVLTGASTYADGTMITGGIVNVNADAALGAAAGAIAISNNATLQAGGAVSTTARTLTLGAGGGGTIDTNGNAVTFGVGSTIAGTTLTKIGAGTLTIVGAQSYATLTANAGRTDLTSALVNVASTVNANAAINSSVSQTLADLTIGDGGVFALGTLPPPSPSLADEAAAMLVVQDDILANAAGPADLAALSDSPVHAVPEPGSLGLLGLGAFSLLARRRRNTRS